METMDGMPAFLINKVKTIASKLPNPDVIVDEDGIVTLAVFPNRFVRLMPSGEGFWKGQRVIEFSIENSNRNGSTTVTYEVFPLESDTIPQWFMEGI